MKSIIALSVVGAASAFVTPGQSSSTKLFAANPSLDMEAAEVEEPKKVYPTVNGWTADPDKFCAGLPGAVAPLGEFDPLGFTKGLPVQEIKRFREAEVTHGRVAMLAVIGYLVAEPFHPFFNGMISGPANTHLTQVRDVAPFFFAWLGGSIATAEFIRAKMGWEFPVAAMKKNIAMKEEENFDGKTWLSKLNDNYYPGDLKFDPMNLKPTNAKDFEAMTNKELNNGRLAMIAFVGIAAQELAQGKQLF